MTPLALTALLGALAGAPAPPTPGPLPPLGASVQEDTVDAASTAYEAALTAWREELRAAEERDERRAIRERHPAKEFFPRFETLYRGGDARAAIWMIANARFTDRSRAEAEALAVKLYEELFAGDLEDTRAVSEAAAQLVRDRRAVGEERVLALLTGAYERLEDLETKARVGLTVAQVLARMDGEERAAQAVAWYERVVEECPDTEAGAEALDAVFEQKYLSIGATAPAFGGQTVDGEELELSDYRGRIVVLDFFGFW